MMLGEVLCHCDGDAHKKLRALINVIFQNNAKIENLLRPNPCWPHFRSNQSLHHHSPPKINHEYFFVTHAWFS